MKKFLSQRLDLTGIITSLIGGVAIDQFMRLENYRSYYVFAPVLTLIISLIISFFLKGKFTEVIKKQLKIFSVICFVGLAVSCYLFFSSYTDNSFSYHQPDGTTKQYLKGTELTKDAADYRSTGYFTDEELVKDFEGPANIEAVWEVKTINNNKKIIFVEYFFFILFASVLIYTMLEILTTKYKWKPEV